METGKLRYAALAAGTGLVITGWIMDKLPPEVGPAVIAAIIGIATIDMYKHRKVDE